MSIDHVPLTMKNRAVGCGCHQILHDTGHNMTSSSEKDIVREMKDNSLQISVALQQHMSQEKAIPAPQGDKLLRLYW